MKKNNENEINSESQDWKQKFNDLMHSCQMELKRTTKIGMKMLSASQSNAQLKEAYEELGRIAKRSLIEADTSWPSQEARKLAERIVDLEKELEGFENEVRSIKKSS